MKTISQKIWFRVMVLVTLAICAVSSIASAEEIDIHNTYSWMSYGEGMVSLFTYNESADAMKVIRVYYNAADFILFSEFTDAFEEDVNEIHDLVVLDFEDSLSEVIGLVNIDGVSWMATWTPENGYTFSMVESSTTMDEME